MKHSNISKEHAKLRHCPVFKGMTEEQLGSEYHCHCISGEGKCWAPCMSPNLKQSKITMYAVKRPSGTLLRDDNYSKYRPLLCFTHEGAIYNGRLGMQTMNNTRKQFYKNGYRIVEVEITITRELEPDEETT